MHDAVELLATMAGADASDLATAGRPRWVPEQLIEHLDPTGLQDKRIGVLRSSAGFHTAVDGLLEKAVTVMRDSGATIFDGIE